MLLAPEFYLPLRNMGTHYHARLEAIGAAEKIVDILDMPLPKQYEQSSVNKPFAKSIAIDFDHISYCYDDRGKALDDFNVHIPAGHCIALVGKSGAGKSTVIRLLAGFIQPTQGNITINAIPLHQFDIADWRKQIAWVPQNPHLFQGSIRDNIALGMNHADDKAICKAAKLASIHDYIETLEEGYNTKIGERGQGLSGGQIQRIALARAFLKDAPVILLDEATANLDVESEQLIQQSIMVLAKNRTVIMIAHRLKTVEQAEQILVMDQGKIVESGSHDDLLEKSGLYAQLIHTFSEVER
ncbi:MAG: ATP-binding cassette domain-containing protein [Gammaproteobacteria bacterium]|nr:ATP-binding cassette domain-containing protein [Gammaproteobacteria bacterium]